MDSIGARDLGSSPRSNWHRWQQQQGQFTDDTLSYMLPIFPPMVTKQSQSGEEPRAPRRPDNLPRATQRSAIQAPYCLPCSVTLGARTNHLSQTWYLQQQPPPATLS